MGSICSNNILQSIKNLYIYKFIYFPPGDIGPHFIRITFARSYAKSRLLFFKSFICLKVTGRPSKELLQPRFHGMFQWSISIKENQDQLFCRNGTLSSIIEPLRGLLTVEASISSFMGSKISTDFTPLSQLSVVGCLCSQHPMSGILLSYQVKLDK